MDGEKFKGYTLLGDIVFYTQQHPAAAMLILTLPARNCPLGSGFK
jgi:hypothetical protein